MKRLWMMCLFLLTVSFAVAMEQQPSGNNGQFEDDPDLEDFVIVEPSDEMINSWLKEAMAEKVVVDDTLNHAPQLNQKDMTSWQAFKNKLAGIPQGLGYVGRVLGVLSTSRWYLDSTLSVILAEEENKLSVAEKKSFELIRAKVKEIIDAFEARSTAIQKIPDENKRANEASLLPGEFLKDMQFLLRLQEPNPYGVLSPDAHLLLMLTYLKDIRVIQQGTDKVTEIFKEWSEFVTNFSAELLNDRKIVVEGVERVRNPHANTDANVTVRPFGAISQTEREVFLPARRKKNIEKQRELLGDLVISDQPVAPVNNQTGIRIGLVMSGGGYRAMTLAAGYLEALEELGILDAASHVSGLSGSTWFLSGWLQSGLSVKEFNKDLASRMPFMQVDYLALRAMDDPVRKKALHYDIMLPKFAFNQPIGSVDIFGWLLSQAVLQGNYNVGISDQWQLVKDGDYPLPVYTTVSMHNASLDESKPHYRYNWYEVNPLEFENIELGLSIPVWSLGREFNNGKSLRTKGLPTYPFEQSFGYMLATFGSAYTIDFLKEGSQFVGGALGWILSGIQKVKTIKRLWPAQSNNPWLGMNSQPKWVQQKPLLTFVDAGIDFNLPVPPLLKRERGLDLIIIGDSSSDIYKTVLINDHAYPAEFGKFLLYLHNQRFDAAVFEYHIADMLYEPYSGDDQAPFLVYKPKEGIHNMPWLVYINYEKNPDVIKNVVAGSDQQLKDLAAKIETFNPIECEKNGFCGTFNFKYTPEQFEQLKTMGQFNVLAHKKHLINALERQFAIKSARVSCLGCMTMGAFKGDMNLVDSYIKKGFDVNARTEGVPGIYADDAITPLHAAAIMNNVEIAEFLLDSGAGINQLSNDGVSVLEAAVRMNKIDMVRFLLQYNPEITQKALLDADSNPLIKSVLQAELKRRETLKKVLGQAQEQDTTDAKSAADAQIQRLQEREQEKEREQAAQQDNDVPVAQVVPAPGLVPAINNLVQRLNGVATALGRASRNIQVHENLAGQHN